MSETAQSLPQQQGNAPAKKPVTGLEIFGYGWGGLAVNLLIMVASNYIIFFFTDVAGLTVGTAGLIYAVSKIVDAVTDPLMGTIADNTISRWGRMRPYMMFGGVFAALSLVMLFTAVNFGNTGKTIYYMLAYCCWSIAYTIVATPYQSSTSIVTGDKHKRNLLVMSGKLLAVPAGLVVANMHTIVKLFGGGDDAWQKAAMVMGVIIVVSLFICALATRRFDTREAAEKQVKAKDHKRYKLRDRIQVVTKNKALLMLVIAFGTNNLAAAATKAVQNYYAKYVLEDIGFIARVGNIGTLLMIPLFALTPFICKKFAKRSLFIFGTIIHVVPSILFLVLGTNASALRGIIDPLFILSTLAGFFCNILAFMMLPDCVDFGVRKVGIVSAALITSTFTFCNKLSDALGGMLSTGILNFVGYTPDQDFYPKAVLMGIIICMSIPTVFSDICSYIAMKLYPIDERKTAAQATE